MEINILSAAADPHNVEAYCAAIKALRDSGYIIRHSGISFQKWYLKDVEKTYKDAGEDCIVLPRVTNISSSWWQTPGINSEFAQTKDVLDEFLHKLIGATQPDVFIIADDTGPLELLTISIFKEFGIPIILLEHGYGFAFNLEIDQKNKQLNNFRLELIKIAKNILVDLGLKPQFGMTIPTNIFGKNGEDYICTFSKLTEQILIKHGVDKNKIRSTGYPYFDKFVKQSSASGEPISRIHESHEKLRILIISSGYGLFGNYERASQFYKFVNIMVKSINRRSDIYIRLKQGENISKFLQPQLLNELIGAGIKFNDNSVSTLQTIEDFDLIMGDSSMVLFEAIILHKPVILLANYKSTRNEIISTEKLLLNTLGCLQISDEKNVNEVIELALQPRYTTTIRSLLENLSEELFNKLDGNAGLRLSEVIVEAKHWKNKR